MVPENGHREPFSVFFCNTHTFHYATNYEFLNNMKSRQLKNRPKINRQQRKNQLVLAQEGNPVYNEVRGL